MPIDETPAVDGAPGATLFVPDLPVMQYGGESIRDGLTIPGYDILAKLGEGGMGIVYHARDLKNQRDVAVKVTPHATATGSREMVRFLAEVEMIAEIRHPHVVRVLAFGDQAGRPFLVMEYLEGGTLADRLDHGPLEPLAAAKLLSEIARAVHAAHTSGIVHRDLKPRNILFDGNDQPRVTDFGIAKRSTSDLTATQEVMGTPAYMAPEQAKGGTKFVGPAADVWALGAILYECITGERPFNGAGINSVLYRVVHDEPVPPCSVRESIPRDLERVCLKCLQKEPNDRYSTAEALAADLTNFAEGRPVGVRPPGPAERLLRWARNDPSRATAYALTALVIGLIGVGTALSLFWQKAEAARGVAEAEHKRTTETLVQLDAEKTKSDQLAREALHDRDAAVVAQREEAAAKSNAEQAREQEALLRKQMERALEHTDRIEYSKIIDLAHRDFAQANSPERARELLASCREKFRGWEWQFLNKLIGPDVPAYLGEHVGDLNAVRWSADGKAIVTLGTDGNAILWNAKTSVPIVKLPVKAQRTAAEFSPDGTRVATADAEGRVIVWDAKTGTPLVTLPTHEPIATSVAFSPDGNRLITTGGDKSARIWDAKTGTFQRSLGGSGEGYRQARYNHDGSIILTAGNDGTPRLWDADNAKELAALRGFAQPLRTAVFCQDGSRILCAWSNGTIRVFDTATHNEITAFTSPAGVIDAAINADGTAIATVGNHGIVRVWSVPTGKEAGEIKITRGGLRCVAFHPEGKSILLGDNLGNARLWDLSRPPDEWTLASKEQGLDAIAVSADGHRLLIRQPSKGLGLVDAITAENWQALTLPGGKLEAAAFSPDGRTIALAGTAGLAGLWDTKTGQPLATIPVEASTCVTWSTGSNQVILGGEDGNSWMWDVKLKAVSHRLRGPKSPVAAAAFSHDGRRAATVYQDGTGIVWDTTDGRQITDFRNERDGLASVAFFPDGQRLVTGSRLGSVRIWDTNTGLSDGALGGGRTVGIAVAMSPDGSRILTGSPKGWVRLWDTASGASVFEREVSRDGLDLVRFSPDGRKLIAGARGSKIVLWEGPPREDRER